MFDAINSCVPQAVEDYMAEHLEEMKTMMGYADMTTEEQAEFDEKVAAKKADKLADAAEMKAHAGYHEMTPE